MQIILLFVCIALGGIVVETAGTRVKRVGGGTQITIQQARYIVSLRRAGRHVCGGALISAQHVLTTAHCVVKGSRHLINETTVVSGTDHINITDIGHTIRNIDIHENFEEKKFGYDIAVITLVAPVETNAKRNAIALPHALPPYGEVARFVAFKTRSHGYSDTALQELDVQIEHNLINEGYYDHVFYGKVEHNGRISGVDHGSPLVYGERIVGLVSKMHVKSSHFSYFVNVVKFMKFIKKFTGEGTLLNSELGMSTGNTMGAGTSSDAARPSPLFRPFL